MRYMLLIYADASANGDMSKEQEQAEFEEYFAVTQEMNERGVREAGEPLQSVNTATTVRVKNGKPITTDGPFAETKEHLVGYYILKCKNLDEALEFAAKIPDARHGAVEVRPIMELNLLPAS